MAILVQCTNCSRKLRVQDHLLGKTVKCPICQTKFQAEQVDDTSTKPPGPVAPAEVEEITTTAVAPAANPEPTLPPPALPTLEVAEPASAQPHSTETAAKEKVVLGQAIETSGEAAPAAAPVLPTPQPFETAPLKVFAVIAAILFLTALFGCGLGWWLGAAVQNTKAAAASETP
jgi:hypothetical protein